MGELRRHPIKEWRVQYGLQAMAETGTWRGDGVRAALDAGYPMVITVDVCGSDTAQERVQDDRVQWLQGESTLVLPKMLRLLGDRPTLWWLDAHLPERYGAQAQERTPLLAEVTTIIQDARPHAQDVVVCDDTRLYSSPCNDGPLPEGIAPADPRHLEAICMLLEASHIVTLDRRNTGYLVALPKQG